MMNWLKKVKTIKTIDTSDLVQKAKCNRKIAEIEKKISGHDKYVTAIDFNKFVGAIFDKRLKQVKLMTLLLLSNILSKMRKNRKTRNI